jgi:POT family proton-dependent oligopeptide transporter
MADPQTAKARFPSQIKFIIGNEACERFSFYGMRNILTIFVVDYLLRNASPHEKLGGESVLHWFSMGVYFFPLLGGVLADRFWGKYRTVLWLSLVYTVGQLSLAFFIENKLAFYGGLFLIALGSGGIKPCVSSFAGDQFTSDNKPLIKKLFAVFYWSINLGSFFASAFIPKVLALWGPAIAFGIPGVLMGIATVVFWSGRRRYAHVPPTGPNPHFFLWVIFDALGKPAKKGAHWLDAALGKHPQSAIDAAKAVLRVLVVFLPVPFFWMLFDQKASTWVIQAKSMDLQVGPWKFEPSQLQLINPALVMILIPLTQKYLYPFLERVGLPLKPLRKMTIGMFLAALSFVWVALIQRQLDAGVHLSVLWQSGPYVLLTLGEVLISVTGLEFAYTQAPLETKGIIQSFWSLAVTLGNFVVVLFKGRIEDRATSLFFFATITAVAGIAMGLIARWYKEQDWVRRVAQEGGQAAGPAAAAGPAPAKSA